jgi:hypothetical protein
VAAAKAEPPARPAAASVQAAAASAAPAPNDGPLLEEQIQATIARYAGAFEGCAAQAHRQEPQLVAEQRKVTITMTVTPAGKVLYPTLDDQELSNSGLGACLKREAAKMAFPEFGGEPVRVRMPLVVK